MTWLTVPRLAGAIGTTKSGDALETALAAHAAWINDGVPRGAGDSSQIALGARELVRIPDLSAAQLSLAHVSVKVDQAASGGVLLGYLGPNGCRLGLWIFDAGRAGFGAPLRTLSRNGTDVHVWQKATP